MSEAIKKNDKEWRALQEDHVLIQKRIELLDKERDALQKSLLQNQESQKMVSRRGLELRLSEPLTVTFTPLQAQALKRFVSQKCPMMWDDTDRPALLAAMEVLHKGLER